MHEMNVLDLDGNKIKHFTQWDQNQKIIIEGMTFTAAPQVHFYNEKSISAHTMESELLNDLQIEVEVPNDLLTENLPIAISIYFPNVSEAGGKTVLHTRIPVKEKKIPENFIYKNNVNAYDFKNLEDTLNDCKNTTQNAKDTISNAETAVQEMRSDVNNAISSANSAGENANAAAVAAYDAAYNVSNGDISTATVTFDEALERANIQSGESLGIALGKLSKLYTDLDNHAYYAPINDLTTTETGKALDATMGKELDGKISTLSSNTLKIANFGATISEITSGTNAGVDIDYSSLSATSVKAVIPYTLGGIPLSISINGITNTACKLYVRNDTDATLTDRIIRINVLYV